MKLKLVSRELAIELKKVGFDIDCEEYKMVDYITFEQTHLHDDDMTILNIPTLELAKMWFREKHNIHVYIAPAQIKGKGMHSWAILIPYKKHVCESHTDCTYASYEEVLELGLLKACELIKIKKDG